VIDIELLWMLVPVVLGVAGAVCLVVGVRNFVRTRRFVNQASSTTGRVTDVKTRTRRSHTSSGPRVSTYRYPVVRFQTQDGQSVEFESETGTNTFSQKPGEQVEVLYDPLRPEQARIKSFMMLWFGPLIFSVVGFFLLVFGSLFGLVALLIAVVAAT
jgi:cytochrome c-type biogenesis protein CcmH/NrfF